MTQDRKNRRMLGIIGCRLFEDEIVHILSNDDEISKIFVVQNEESDDIIKKLEGHDMKGKSLLVKEEGLPEMTLSDGLNIILWLKPMALHSKPEKLNEDVLATISKLENVCGTVLLFYGLCGNAFKHIEKESRDCAIPVIILKDQAGNIVDDCIGTILGGTDEYYQLLKRSSGTFFLTPMWASNWRELFHKVQILSDPNDIEGAKYIFKCVGYKKVCKMDTGLGDLDKFDREIDEFATTFNFEKGVVPCTLEVVQRSYSSAKETLDKIIS